MLFYLCVLIGVLLETVSAEESGPAKSASMILSDAGAGLDQAVTVESKGQFRLVFEAGDNWGIAQWYDLVNDPDAKTNLAFSKFEDPGVREAGLFQMVWSGTDPDDPKLYMGAAKAYQPKSVRSFTVLEKKASRIVVEAISHPLLAAGVLANVTVAVRYYIYPDGKIYIGTRMSSAKPQAIKEWRCAVIGLCDPTQMGTSATPDSQGWLRASAMQNPYKWSGRIEKYIFAYWTKSTPAPNSNWTKASIMLVPAPGNPHMTGQSGHNWTFFKRWYYNVNSISMNAGETIVQDYLMQLGAENSSILPNIIDSSVADPIANAYIADQTPPGGFVEGENKGVLKNEK